MMFRGYRYAIWWIACNDEPLESDLTTVSELLTVSLVADLFNVTREEVARAVLAERATLK